MADMTIKELADELGVSKQAIRKHLEKLPPTLSVTKKENAIYLDTDVSRYVRSKVTRVTDNVTGKVTSNQFHEKGTKKKLKSEGKPTNTYEVEKILLNFSTICLCKISLLIFYTFFLIERVIKGFYIFWYLILFIFHFRIA
ncbi:HTH domain-containing protein [Ruoffia sp. FAM 20858]|uniref:HTH domain-containing protein n=1 Tax=Ruoffia sp. FAM 20858 TaxID=3259516 RepID=UPI0038856663